MITIHDYDVPSAKTWSIAIRGMRYSWQSQDKSDSAFVRDDFGGPLNPATYDFHMGDADKALALRLIKIGDDHGKVARQLPVIIDITAPESFFWQMDTYKIGTTKNSTSTMHSLGKDELTADMFDWSYMPDDIRDTLLACFNTLRTRWLDSGKHKGPEQEEWEALINGVSRGLLFRAAWSANYQVLRDIYHSRKKHRFGNWRVLCAWIETLPHSELITVE